MGVYPKVGDIKKRDPGKRESYGRGEMQRKADRQAQSIKGVEKKANSSNTIQKKSAS